MILVIRIFGAETWGKIIYYYSIAGLYSVFADLGLSQAYSKFLASDDDERDISTFLFLKALLIVVTFVVFSGAYFLKLRYGQLDGQLLWLVFGVLIAELVSQFFTMTFVGKRDFKYYSGVEIIAALIALAYTLFVCFVKPDLYLLAASKFVLPLITILGGVVYFHKKKLPYFSSLTRVGFRKYFSYSLPIAFSSIVGRFLSHFDKIALGSLIGLKEVGFYQVAMRCYGMFDRLIKPVTNTMFTEIAHRVANVPGFFHKKFQDLRQVLSFCSGLLTICLVFGSGFVVETIFGIENVRAGFILKFLGLSIVARLFWRPYSHIIYAIEKHKLIAMLDPLTAVVTVGLYYLLIPMNISGVNIGAAALPMAEFVVWIFPVGFLRLFILRHHFGNIGAGLLLVKVGLPLAVIIVAGYFVNYSVFALLPAVVVFIIVEIYFGILTKARLQELMMPFRGVIGR